MKKILVLYQDWDNWFLNSYEKFEHWFKEKDGAYSKDNEYYILSLSTCNKILKPENNITVELFKSSPTKQLFDLIKFKKRLKEVINEFKPDYIYVPFLYLASTIPKDRNFKVISFLRDITPEMIKGKGGIRKILGNIFYILDYLALKKTDILLYNAFHLKEYALKMRYKGKLIFCPRDITDKEYFNEISEKEIIEIVRKYNLKNKRIILTVARLTPEKNIEMGIKALRFLPKDYVYIIVGEGRDEKRLVNLAKKLGVYDRVVFIGYVKHKEIWKYYKVADVLWLLSKSNFEGIPNVIMESWYSKTPVIVSNIKVFKYLIKNYKTGIVLKSWDEKELAEKTEELLKNNKLYKDICENGWKYVNELIRHHIDVRELFR
ncbi:glycosyltransferase [Methanotorris igneus]|nr:glycosyltransferase [Methanotorris igneus]